MTIFSSPRIFLNTIRPLDTGRGKVIVTGMQKSGTTAIAKLLGAAISLDVSSDPFYRLSRKNIDFRQQLYSRKISLGSFWKRYRHYFDTPIVKDPNFVLMMPQLRDLFPDAQLVTVVRDPRDTIRSILNRLSLPGNPEGICLDEADIPSTWRAVLRGENPSTPGNNYIEVLANRWLISAEAIVTNRDRAIEIRYEDFKLNKADSIESLAARLGYKQTQNIDHLVNVQFQPKGNAAVSWSEFFGTEHVDVIDRIAHTRLNAFGYESHHHGS